MYVDATAQDGVAACSWRCNRGEERAPAGRAGHMRMPTGTNAGQDSTMLVGRQTPCTVSPPSPVRAVPDAWVIQSEDVA